MGREKKANPMLYNNTTVFQKVMKNKKANDPAQALVFQQTGNASTLILNNNSSKMEEHKVVLGTTPGAKDLNLVGTTVHPHLTGKGPIIKAMKAGTPTRATTLVAATTTRRAASTFRASSAVVQTTRADSLDLETHLQPGMAKIPRGTSGAILRHSICGCILPGPQRRHAATSCSTPRRETSRNCSTALAWKNYKATTAPKR